MSDSRAAGPRSGQSYQNAALTFIAIALGLLAIDRLAEPRHAGAGVLTLNSAAIAQPQPRPAEGPADGSLANALDQRRQMIAELRTLNTRLERIEAKLAQPFNVRVMSMPPVTVNERKPENP